MRQIKQILTPGKCQYVIDMLESKNDADQQKGIDFLISCKIIDYYSENAIWYARHRLIRSGSGAIIPWTEFCLEKCKLYLQKEKEKLLKNETKIKFK